MPSAAEWRAVGEVTVKGSTALGCETKMVREWVRVSCSGTNDSGGTPTRVAVQRGGGPGTFVHSAPGLTSLVVPYVEDTHFAAVLSWTDKSHVLRLDWAKGGPKPHIIGVFEGAASPLSQRTATCAGKTRCPVAKPICAITPGGPRCVAMDSAEYQSVPPSKRLGCAHQSDCLGGDACFFPWAEDAPLRTLCGPYAGGNVVCDLTQKCPPEDESCVPCLPLRVPVAGLPWLGLQ